MSKILEIIGHQNLVLYTANKNNIKVILSQNQHMALNIVDIFNLGVIVGKREERKKRAHRSNEDPLKIYIKSLLDETERRRSLKFVCKYLEGARFIK